MKKIAYVGSLGVIALLTTEFGVIGILPQIASHYDITIEHAGLLLSLFALVIAVAGPFMTLFTSGIDRKKVMLLALSLFFVSAIISFFQPPFWLLLIVRVIPAFLHPVYYATALGAVVSASDPKQTHKLMALVLSGISIATVTTLPLATYIASVFEWQDSFLIQALASAIALLAIYKIIPPMPVKEKVSYGNQVKIIFKPDFLLSAGIIFFMVSAWFSTYSYFADYLGKSLNMSATMVSYMMLLFGATGILGNWIAGKALAKSILATSLISLSGTLLVALGFHLSGQQEIVNILLIAIWGLLYGPIFFIASATITSAAPNAIEFASSIGTSFINLGITVGTAVGGWAISVYGIENTPWVGLVFGILSAVIMLIRHSYKSKTLAIA